MLPTSNLTRRVVERALAALVGERAPRTPALTPALNAHHEARA